MRVILLLFVASGVAMVAAVKMLPWWGILLLSSGLLLGAVVLLKWGVRRLFLIPFKAKGAVLRGAEVEVHAVERTEALPPELAADREGDPASAASREYYRLDCTITPRPPSGEFALWEPGGLMLVGPHAKPDASAADDASACEVLRVEVKHNGRFEPDEGMKYEGPQRLRLVLAAPAGARELQFQYYLEQFGKVSLR